MLLLPLARRQGLQLPLANWTVGSRHAVHAHGKELERKTTWLEQEMATEMLRPRGGAAAPPPRGAPFLATPFPS